MKKFAFFSIALWIVVIVIGFVYWSWQFQYSSMDFSFETARDFSRFSMISIGTIAMRAILKN
jgi:hypothetical protein